MQYVGGRGDGVRTQEQGASALFRSHDEAPCGSRIAVHIGVCAGLHAVSLDTVCRHRGMCVVAVVPACMYDFGVGLVYGWFLGKFGLELAEHCVHIAVE